MLLGQQVEEPGVVACTAPSSCGRHVGLIASRSIGMTATSRADGRWIRCSHATPLTVTVCALRAASARPTG